MSGESSLDLFQPTLGMGIALPVEATKTDLAPAGVEVEVSPVGGESSFDSIVTLLLIFVAFHASIREDLENVLHGVAVEVVGEGEANGIDGGVSGDGGTEHYAEVRLVHVVFFSLSESTLSDCGRVLKGLFQ